MSHLCPYVFYFLFREIIIMDINSFVYHIYWNYIFQSFNFVYNFLKIYM